MARAATNPVLTDLIGAGEGAALWTRRLALVAFGIAAMAIAAKIKVPFWPVPITMQTFVVLTLGAAYGARLGAVTILAYLAVGALGLDVFTGSGADLSGLAYMTAGTGGYLLGFVLAAALMGHLARRGWDRDAGTTALAMLAGNALIYVPGLLWLGVLHGWDKPILEWGLYPFLLGDAAKLGLAALLLPLAWKAAGGARS